MPSVPDTQVVFTNVGTLVTGTRGFEDCLILDRLLDKHNNNFGAVLQEYSKVRNKDAEVICDLSMDNYLGVRSLVNSSWFLLKRKLMYALGRLMPKMFIPLHTMVTFTQIPYQEVVERNQRHKKMVSVLIVMGSLTGLAGVMVILKTWSLRLC